MVDQERMKEYIAMGMSIDDSLKLCQEEDAQAKKEAAKEAKAAAANEPPAEPKEPEEGPKFITEDEVKKLIIETTETQIREAKLKNATGNEGGEVPKERTIDDIMSEAVNRMRTGK